MTTTGDVEIEIIDNGVAVSVPSSAVQAVIGCSSAGTVNQVVATRSITTLASILGDGPLPQAAALVIAKGGTVLAVRATTAYLGTVSSVASSALGGTSVVSVTGDPLDAFHAKVLVARGGTVGVAGVRIQVSLDAGRTFGVTVGLGTASSYAIPNTGLTLNFAAGTLVQGATYTFGATAPAWDAAGLAAALTALQASSYATAGWGSLHIVGDIDGAAAATLQLSLETLAVGKIYTRAITSARDASPPAAYGGTGESEQAWTTDLLDDFSALDAKRVLVTAGHYNMPSAIPNTVAGAPRYRRPLSWALAARQVTIAPQRHAGRVKDGALSNIVVDPTSDPVDGFIYHDERMNPNFDQARFAAARTRVRLTGFYVANPNLMSPLGSVFTILPFGNVMDIACQIISEVGQRDINEDVRLNQNGTLFENDAVGIENGFRQALDAEMVAVNMISEAVVAADRGWNVRTTSKVKVAVTIFGRGYVLEEDVTVGFGQAEVAAA